MTTKFRIFLCLFSVLLISAIGAGTAAAGDSGNGLSASQTTSQVEIVEPTLSPSRVNDSSTTHTLSFDVYNLSYDGAKDTFQITVPDGVSIEGEPDVRIVAGPMDDPDVTLVGNTLNFSVNPNVTADEPVADVVPRIAVDMTLSSGDTDETDPRGPTEGTEWDVTITRVIDGDTVEAQFPNGEVDTIRLLGVDTPETNLNSVSPTEFEGISDTTAGSDHLLNWGENASNYAEQQLNNQDVRVVVDEQADRRGSFGRLLGHIYVDDENFNKQLLSEGYARLYDSEFSKQSEFESAEQTAQDTETGLWDFDDSTDNQPDSDIAVTEIHEDAEGNEFENLDDEYITFTNNGNSEVDMSGWTVSDAADHVYTFPSGFSLATGQSVTLYTGSGPDTDSELYWGEEAPVWNNGGDTITLEDTSGTVVLQRQY